MDETPSSALTDQVISALLEVSNTLGAGLFERVYHQALVIELNLRGLKARAQSPFKVHYKGKCVGVYYADILVRDTLILELKCVEHLSIEHRAQCLNYLKVSAKPSASSSTSSAPKPNGSESS
ncbi:MAG: hypothetical protein QOJ99_4616 [Bryobacterales bacterium]|jgi:GxxExxY protein|nr:hypothetical protein [Bryobacterales bacterium]